MAEMGVEMSGDPVSAAYTTWAARYIAVVGAIEHADERDRDVILDWALDIDGPILDVGCGPGQWTDYLRQQGAEIQGIDPVEVFVAGAKTRYPQSTYRVGRAEFLPVADASLGGILAWFSLTHTHPDLIGAPLAEFARCIQPDGSLLIGFVDGPAREAFDHRVITAYYWSMDALTELLEAAGFVVTDSDTRADPGVRPQGRISARRG